MKKYGADIIIVALLSVLMIAPVFANGTEYQ